MLIIFIIEQYTMLLSNTIVNPFSNHAAFGTSLWSSTMENELEAVPVSTVICHLASRPWVNRVVLIKELNRVSVNILNCISVTHEAFQSLSSARSQWLTNMGHLYDFDL